MPAAPRLNPAIAFILVTAALDVMAIGIIIPVLPALIVEFTGSDADAGIWNGIMVALWAGMQFLFSPVIGSLSDRYGRRPVILVSALGLAADFALMALAPSLWWLALGRILGGITSSSFTTTFAYMADITPPEQRSRAYGLIGAAYSAGFVLGPLAGGLLGELGPRVPFWAAAGLALIAFIYGLLVIPESLKPELRMPFSWRRANPVGSLKLLRSHRDLAGLAWVYFIIYVAHNVFAAVFVLYAGYRFGWSIWAVGLSLALWGVLDIIAQALLVGPAVKRFGDRATMIFGLVFGAVSLFILGLAPDEITFVIGIFVSGMWAFAMPTIQSLMTSRVSESEQGQLQGANQSVASIASVAAPIFFGWIYALSVGAAPVIPIAGAAFVVAGLVLAFAVPISLRAARQAEGLAE